MSVNFISHPDCALHQMGDQHPECPGRLYAISDQLISSGLDISLIHLDAPKASFEDLNRVHTAEYIKRLQALSPKNSVVEIDADTSMNQYSLEAAYYAAGAGILAVDQVMQGNITKAFCSVRPTGHHAERDRAMGFCMFNNIAVAAAYAMEKYQLKHVAIVDFDVHHGNGTEDIFKTDPRVLICSTFQHPLYPHSGIEIDAPNIINMPLAPNSDAQKFRDAITNQCLPALEKHQPEIIFISAGFDAHCEDPLADLRLKEDDYYWVTDTLKTVADQYAGGKIVSMLEGGYNLSALGRSVVAHIKAMI